MRFFPESLKTAGKTCLFVALAVVCVQTITPNQALASSQPYISAHQINFGTGNKYLSATDARLSEPGELSLVDNINTITNPNHAN